MERVNERRASFFRPLLAFPACLSAAAEAVSLENLPHCFWTNGQCATQLTDWLSFRFFRLFYSVTLSISASKLFPRFFCIEHQRERERERGGRGCVSHPSFSSDGRSRVAESHRRHAARRPSLWLFCAHHFSPQERKRGRG